MNSSITFACSLFFFPFVLVTLSNIEKVKNNRFTSLESQKTEFGSHIHNTTKKRHSTTQNFFHRFPRQVELHTVRYKCIIGVVRDK